MDKSEREVNMPWLTFIWENKSWILLVTVTVAAALIISAQHVNLNFKKAKIEKQQSTIETLTRANQIMTQNAKAAIVAQKQMHLIQRRAVPLRKIAASLPQQTKDCLNNEKMDLINNCLGAFFRDGVLPEACADAAILPHAAETGMGARR